jgi:hypothetical protein
MLHTRRRLLLLLLLLLLLCNWYPHKAAHGCLAAQEAQSSLTANLGLVWTCVASRTPGHVHAQVMELDCFLVCQAGRHVPVEHSMGVDV